MSRLDDKIVSRFRSRYTHIWLRERQSATADRSAENGHRCCTELVLGVDVRFVIGVRTCEQSVLHHSLTRLGYICMFETVARDGKRVYEHSLRSETAAHYPSC